MKYCNCNDPLGVGLHKCPDCGKFYSQLDQAYYERDSLLTACRALVTAFDVGDFAYTTVNGRGPDALRAARVAVAMVEANDKP
jgi:hypothetical protein